MLLESGSGIIAAGSSVAGSHIARIVEGGAVLLLSSTFLSP